MSESKTPMVKLEAPVAMTPVAYRQLLASIAASLCAPTEYYASITQAERVVEIARFVLTACGITEALVPQQHADSLSEQDASLAFLYPDKESK